MNHWRKIKWGSSGQYAHRKSATEADDRIAFVGVVFLVVYLFFAPGFVWAQADSNKEIYFDVPQQRADEALIQFAEQAGLTFIVPFDQLEGVTTNELIGSFSPENALGVLLSGTQLQAEISEQRLAINKSVSSGGESHMNNRTRVGIFGALVGFFGAGDAAFAQAPEGITSLEEVVVTARRREENLQEVPVAISAFSENDLEMRNIESTEDLQLSLPNVDIRGGGRQGGAQGNFTVRGVQGVARYIDGVALTGTQAGLANVLELERIEVLRGPQGTYFGKNAIGGAIQFVTKKPAEEFGARVKGTIGSFDRQDLVVNVDIPISDTVKTKITAASLYQGGYVESTTINQSYGERNNDILMGQLAWDPTDNFSALFTATSNVEESEMQAYVLFDVVDDFPVGPDTPGQYEAAGVEFTDELYAYGQREQYLSAANYTGPGVDFDSTSFSATLDWDINDSVSVKSITGARDFHYGVWIDSDASPLGFFNTWAYDEVEEFSQEFQLYGGTDSLDWIVGVYYQNAESTEVDNNFQSIELANPRLRNSLGSAERTDTAVFAEAVYAVTDKLSVTVGARYSEEEVENRSFIPAYTPVAEDFQTPNYSTENNGLQSRADGSDAINTGDFDALTPRIAVQYQVNEDVMVYAGMAEGFNGGGTNNTYNEALPENGLFSYDQEILTNYEAGVRADLFDNMLRINATAFMGDWDDIQVGETLLPGVMTTANAGAAEISGLEIEGFWIVNDDISIDFTFGKLDTEYTEIGDTVTAIDLGTPFAFSPETSYSIGLNWAKDLSGGGSFVSRVDYGYISDFETFEETLFQTEIGPNEPYGLVNARFTYSPSSEDYSVAVYGTNLTDEYYRLGGFAAVLGGIDQGVVARPREFGLSLTMDF